MSNIENLKLYDIKFFKWRQTFTLEVYQPLQLKLRGIEFWKKIYKYPNYDSYWLHIYSLFLKMPIHDYPGEVKIHPWVFEARKREYLEYFLGRACFMWKHGLTMLSALYKIYPEFGLEFDQIEAKYVQAWLDILPCIDQLILLLYSEGTFSEENAKQFFSERCSVISAQFIVNKMCANLLEHWLTNYTDHLKNDPEMPFFVIAKVVIADILYTLHMFTVGYLSLSTNAPEFLYSSEEESIEDKKWFNYADGWIDKEGQPGGQLNLWSARRYRKDKAKKDSKE